MNKCFRICNYVQPTIGDSRLRLSEHYRLEQLQEEFNFATDEEIDNSKRFKLIRYRDDEVAEFRNMQIPLFENEISAIIFDVCLMYIITFTTNYYKILEL